MSLFEKRPLCLILAVMLCGFSFMATGLTSAKIAVAIALAALATAAFFLAEKRKFLTALGIGLLVASVFSEIYFGILFYPETRFEKITREFSATVIDADFFDTSGARYTLKTDSLEGEPLSSYTITYTDFTASYEVGDRLFIRGTIGNVDKNSGSFDTKRYYASLGIQGELFQVEKIEILEEKAEITITYRFSRIRKSIADYASELCGTEAGGLLAAVLLGEKSYLPGQMKLDFTAIGISHLLALSGLHLTVLTAGLYFLLRRLRVPKKFRLLISDAFAILYVILTGASPSVMRAALMLLLGSFLYLFMRGKDGITSLLVAVTVLFVIKPYAVFGASIWLSAFATLGILLYGELSVKRAKPKSIPKRIFRFIADALLVSCFALGGTLLLSIGYFDSLSLLAPVATLVFSILIEVVLYIGIPVLIIGRIIPVGIVMQPITRLISRLSGVLADLPGLSVSTDSLFIRLFAIGFSIAFFAFAILPVKHKKIYAAGLCTFLFLGLSVGALTTGIANRKESILYQRSGSDEAITISDGGKHVILEMTDTSASDFRTLLAMREFTSPIDSFVITHYEKNLMTSVRTLLSLVRIKEIALPEAKTNAEAEIALAVLDAVEEYRTDVTFYGASNNITVGDSEVVFLYRSQYGDGAPRLLFSICRYDRLYSYFSSGVMEDSEIKKAAAELYDASATAIFGSHGKSYPEGTVFDYSSEKIEELLISDERFLFNKSLASELADVNFIYLSESEELIH